MLPTSYLLASRTHGLLQQIRSIAFNVSNTEVSGYKARHTTVHPYSLSTPLNTQLSQTHIHFPVEGMTFKDESQGAIRRTDNPLHVAIKGEGLLMLTDGTYTRDGELVLTPEGVLTTPSGHDFADLSGGQIRLPENVAKIHIDRLGRLFDLDNKPIGQLRVEEFDNPEAFQKVGENRIDASNALPHTAINTRILQGHLEQSNAQGPQLVAEAQEVATQHKQGHMMTKLHFDLLHQHTNLLVKTNA